MKRPSTKKEAGLRLRLETEILQGLVQTFVDRLVELESRVGVLEWDLRCEKEEDHGDRGRWKDPDGE